MDLESAFLEAALPEPLALLHQQLMPYSLGHDMILHRIKSPFVGASYRLPDVNDLFLAVFTCSHSYDEAWVALRAPQDQFDKQIESWVKLCGEFDPVPIMESCFNYVITGCARPKYRRIIRAKQKIERPGGTPWHATVFTTLTAKLGWSRTDSFNCPYALAQWLHCVWLEQEGAIAITTQDDEDEWKMVKDKLKEMNLEPVSVNMTV